jgi:subtilisin family serine protease
LRVGLVDGGVDRRHPALRHAAGGSFGCGGSAVPSEHGTAVASLLVGRDRGFEGAAVKAELFVADVYCDKPDGGSAEEVVRALAWMARERVAVVNVSLVGPQNRLLEQGVAALVKRGHLLVAAVGNDGPAAPPLFPASYAGVVGVTGVNASRRVLPEAAQGPQVMWSAPGADMAVARSGGGYGVARGTSFAAPLVAGLLAAELRVPDVVAAAAAVEKLATGAVDLGAPGRDPVYGRGFIAEDLRVVPEQLQARQAR